MGLNSFSLKHFFYKYKVEQVFTPNKPAKLTYVDRKLNNYNVENILVQPGLQVVVCGESLTGKSTLIRNKLNNLGLSYVFVNCIDDDTFDTILLKIFDEFNNEFIENERTFSKKLSSGNYWQIAGFSATNLRKHKRIVNAQKSPERLYKLLSKNEILLVIEDCHKLSDTELNKISNYMKVFSDNSDESVTKIILIAVVNSSERLLKRNKHMEFRLEQVPIPFMNDNQLEDIITKGEHYLNIIFDEKVKKDIVMISKNRANILHRLCLECCMLSNIEKSQVYKKRINKSVVNKAVQNLLISLSDSLKNKFTKALINVHDGYDERTLKHAIIDTLVQKDIHGDSEYNIIRSLKNMADYYQLDSLQLERSLTSAITNSLLELTTSEYGYLLKYDKSFDKYQFIEPTTAQYATALFNINQQVVDSSFFYMEIEDIIDRLQKNSHLI